jgi:uncharacterized membrane protein YfcA
VSEHRHVPEPGETIYLPRPSWAPVFFAMGVVGMVCGIYAAGFIFSPWLYSLVGAIVALFALRSMVRLAIRGFYRLPREQHVHSAALPIEQITLDD